VLAARLVAGRLSDHAGRKPVLLVAITVQAAAMLDVNRARRRHPARVDRDPAASVAATAAAAALIDDALRAGRKP
jgi:MFS family permease